MNVSKSSVYVWASTGLRSLRGRIWPVCSIVIHWSNGDSYLFSEMHHRPIVQWEAAHHGWVPHSKAVVGGYDVNGETLYVGRALLSGDILPGKIVPSHHTCYVPWGGKEHAVRDYQVLTLTGDIQLDWIHASNGHYPSGAIEGGMTGNGEKLFIGRAHHHGSHCIGKVHPNHHTLYIPFGGNEVSVKNYEVLCVKSIGFWFPCCEDFLKCRV